MNEIDPTFKHGKSFQIGVFNHIHKDVVVGHHVQMRSLIEIRPNTKIGNYTYIDSGVKISGDCYIGNNVTIRYDAIIARNVVIQDRVFISPQVMFINIPFREEKIGEMTIIGRNAEIGTGAKIMPGVKIGENVVIGAGAIVTKDCIEEGVYRASSEIVAKKR